MISERIEDGTRILTAETEEDFAQALDMQGPHDEIEAPRRGPGGFRHPVGRVPGHRA